jgi:hypothetical protein
MADTIPEKNLNHERVYPVKSFDRLNSLENERGTDAIIQATSLSVVRCGIRVFRIMREIQNDIEPVSRKDISKAAEAVKQWGKKGLKVKGLLSEDDGIVRQIAKSELEHRPTNRPPDWPIIILALYLRMHLKKETARPHNEWICSFFSEQSISDTLEERRISEWSSRIPNEKLVEAYITFFEIYEAPLNRDYHPYDVPPPVLMPGETAPTQRDIFSEYPKETRRICVDNPTGEFDFYVFPSVEIFFRPLFERTKSFR